MKKLSFLFGSLMLVVAVSSCSKDESTGTNELGTATIKGKVYLTSDVSNGHTAYTSQFAPNTVRLIATIDANDLAQDGTTPGTNQKAYYTNVTSSGDYSFTIDAGLKNVNVTIIGIDIEDDYTETINTGGSVHDTTYKEVYRLQGGQVSSGVVANDVNIMDLRYTNF